MLTYCNHFMSFVFLEEDVKYAKQETELSLEDPEPTLEQHLEVPPKQPDQGQQLVLVPGRKRRGRPPRKDKLDQAGKIVQNIYETNKYNYNLSERIHYVSSLHDCCSLRKIFQLLNYSIIWLHFLHTNKHNQLVLFLFLDFFNSPQQ